MMRQATSILLCLCLLSLHFIHFISTPQSTPPIVHTYVPPLTHTPGLGPSMLGSHSEPPFALLDTLHTTMSSEQKRSMQTLFQNQKTILDEGVRLRLQMQDQTLSLLGHLPGSATHEAWRNRAHHEERIGEVRIWNDLVNR